MAVADSNGLRQHPKWLRGPARIGIDSGEIVLDESRAQTYDAYGVEHSERLLLDMAGLRRYEPRGAVAFVQRHGLLWHGPEDLGSGNCRESLDDWWPAAMKIGYAFGLYVRLMESVRTGSAKPVRGYIHGQLDRFRLPDNDEDCLQWVTIQLGEWITNGLKGCGWVLVAACTLVSDGKKAGGPGDFLFGADPPDLVTAAYSELAFIMANKVEWRECQGCGTWFRPEHGRQTYHDRKCSQNSRKARERATHRPR